MTVWATKIALKLVLGRLPLKHHALRKFGMFKHGRMDEAAYALKIFNIHKNAAFPDGLPENFTALELGPGDSLTSAITANAFGAKKIYLCDAGSFANMNIESYQKLASELSNAGLENVTDLQNITNVQDMLKLLNAEYITNGLDGLRAIPDGSVDLIWSHSVLEHVRKKDFEATIKELNRILKPNTGRASHNVDLQDHLEKSINNLRFPETFWENEIVANSGFYTNRLRAQESLDIMTDSGFEILKQGKGQWDEIPVPRKKLHRDFANLEEDELKTRTYSAVLKRSA